ncbi:MAG TPA: hypothetical protein VN714_32565 [Trebonia sp.]|nr:hypothetical protein [Trebonia sp.]
MSDTQLARKLGDTRFAVDGALEIFDDQVWAPYRPPQDDGDGPVFKMIDPAATEARPSSGDRR